MQVYVVTSGEFSDYGINAIFSTKEKAQEYIDRMEFVSTYNEYYRINVWDVDKESTEILTNDLCVFNGEVVRLDDLNNLYPRNHGHFSYEEYVAYCIFSDLKENVKSRVLEITKEDYLNGLLNNNWSQDEIDIKKVQFPIYCVLDVKYDKNKSVMEKVVYDEVAKYKAMKENII